MEHLHWEVDASPRDTFAVTLDRLAYVWLMDDDNYRKYCADDRHDSFGGIQDAKLAILKPNRRARWHIAVDVGRSGGPITASVQNRATGQALGAPQTKNLKGAPSKKP